MTREERTTRISNLTDGEAISICKYISDLILVKNEILDPITDPIMFIQSLYSEIGSNLENEEITAMLININNKEKVKIMRDLLISINEKVEDSDIISELNSELKDPPKEPSAFLDTISIQSIVYSTLALAALYGIKYKDKKFSFEPSKGAKDIRLVLDGIANVLSTILSNNKK